MQGKHLNINTASDDHIAYVMGYLVHRGSLSFSQRRGLYMMQGQWSLANTMLPIPVDNAEYWFSQWGIGLDGKFTTPYLADDLLPHYLRGWLECCSKLYISRKNPMMLITKHKHESQTKWLRTVLRHSGYTGTFYGNDQSLTIKGQYQLIELAYLVQAENADLPRDSNLWEKLLTVSSRLMIDE
jgi:hypothetical protein